MSSSSPNPFRRSLKFVEQWYRETPQRALDGAYEAARAIEEIEKKHFKGQPVPLRIRTESVMTNYFQSEVQKNLQFIQTRLREFKSSSLVVEVADKLKPPSIPPAPTPLDSPDTTDFTDEYDVTSEEYSSELVSPSIDAQGSLDKLAFIDAVLNRYRSASIQREAAAAASKAARASAPKSGSEAKKNIPQPLPIQSAQNSLYESEFISDDITEDPSKLDSSSFIPRSILRTATRFRKELNPDPGTEDDILNDFRNSRVRTRAAVSFVLGLMIVPLLTQQVSKNLVIGPFVDKLKGPEQIEIRINPEIENEVLTELARFEERLKFESLTSPIPLSPAEIQFQLKAKAEDLKEEYQWDLRQPLKNAISDLFSLVALAIYFVLNRQKIAVLKSFFDEIIYGLSDSAKAFIIILFTDVFVGFHSPHGWEVIVESVLSHFGLPQDRNFINMFIATFPVMLDTVFKYWIFRYLNQISPSAVATYRNMNE
ncbi:proton extrusion protein PcxA [Acaryochloris sp. CCMEE 5410]|uniref:proton extrusion protein PcxA n=1 Tax=Acaryochloris sp. CCMEE 5410 TaxID=310037 RepID=UPI0002483E7D|nr:proton extrusion protein PcxA [Acaryochloris sp. CCMEE 5410]KAI9133411.1 proton extrusion protein PcxA [Acaryochloris sp. CCMEE 5410]